MRKWTRERAVRVASLAAMLATACTVVAVPGVAQADLTVDIACVGVEHATYDPGLRLFTQTVEVTSDVDYPECVSTGSPTITSGDSDTVFGPDEISCLVLLDSGSGEREIVWNTTETSTFTHDWVVSQAGGNTILTETGTITAGKFAGSDAVETLTGGNFSLGNCVFSPGVTTNTTVVVLTITH